MAHLLLHHAGDPYRAGHSDRATSAHDADTGNPWQTRKTPRLGALDISDLVLRFRHRRAGLLLFISMVSESHGITTPNNHEQPR